MQAYHQHRNEKKNELEEELSKLSLMLRYDSRLCSCFINGQTSPEWTAAKVAKECATMHWLHNFTDYEERCTLAATEESKKTWFHSGRHFADHMKRRVYPSIKESIIREKEGAPDEWPWMATTTMNAQADRPTPTTTQSFHEDK